ncbi:MAG: recombinase family protein [Pseudomonadota bacterium]
MVFDHGGALPKPLSEVNNDTRNRGCSGQLGAPKKASANLIGKDPIRSAGRRFGYIRVSTAAQLTDRQAIQLEAECDEMRVEHISAVAAERPIFDTLMAELRAGDTLVVVDLDRAFRSSIDAIMTAQMLRERDVKFRLLSFPLDTASEEGELFYTILAAFAQFERRIISRRTKEGLEAARRRGVRLGRPAQLSSDKIMEAHVWMTETGLPCAYVAALLGVTRLTLQRSFHRMGLTYPISGA